MIQTAIRLHGELTAAREALMLASLATLEAMNEGDTKAARSHRARANGLRAKVGKCLYAFNRAKAESVYQHGHAADVALAGME